MIKACIDVGGTFTDCLVLDDRGELREFKTPTTPKDPSTGLLEVLRKAARFYGRTLAEFAAQIDLLIAHGTTLSTNALLTGGGARVGLIATKGFRDTIQMRRGFKNIRTSRFNVFVPTYRPLVPRHLRKTVQERTLYTGQIQTPLDEADLHRAIEELQAQGIEALAICFLHAYANPENERKAAALCRATLPRVYVTASHEVLPVFREFERFSTTVVSAYVGPITERYLTLLGERLREEGFCGTLYLVQASGMVQSVEETIRRAIYLVGSGPAAAPAAALFCGRAAGVKDLLAVDMGGTSFDVCLIRGGQIPTTTESWVGDERVAIKMVDVHSIGAGGGSIAWVDTLGLLRVGPQSAGAEPGPACYGRGGDRPTVTDADLLLGLIPADNFLGGEMPLDPELARRALAQVGGPLGLDPLETAQTVFSTVNALMVDQIVETSTKRGVDVRDLTLVAGGGAGPVHAAYLAQLLGVPRVIVPRYASTFSAFGMLHMDVGRDFARSYLEPAAAADLTRMNRLYREMEQEAFDLLKALKIPGEALTLSRSAEMRYAGQFHEVEVEGVPAGQLGPEEVRAVVEAFHQRHRELYTFNMPFRPVEFLNLRLKARVPQDTPPLQEAEGTGPDAAAALKRRRRCALREEGGEQEVPVYDGGRLRAGQEIAGPAIIEEPTTTVVVPGAFRCRVDALKNYILTRR